MIMQLLRVWKSLFSKKELILESGIYAIENTSNGKLYVGSAVNLRRRQIQHFGNLKSGCHHNKHLQSAYDLYGLESFKFYVIEYVKPEKLIQSEQYYIDLYGLENLYNLAPIAGSPQKEKPKPVTNEDREKALNAFVKFLETGEFKP